MHSTGSTLKRTLGLLAVIALAHLLGPIGLSAMPFVFGTTATYTTTKSTDLTKIWRKVQGNLLPGFNFMCEEWEYLEDLDNYDVDWSTREITVPVDLSEGYGAGVIAEGGTETRPSSPAPDELTLSFIMFNKRFTASKLTRYIDEKSRNAQIKRQLLYQGKKAVETIARRFADAHWGVSTGYICQTSTAATQSSGAYTLINAFGSTLVAGGTTTQNAYLADRFRVNDWVALIRTGALVANGIGQITAISKTTPSITVTWNGSVASNANDYIVYANSLENTSISGTEYNLGIVGWMDAMTSASVHSLSNATVANWDVAYSDTAGGRYSGLRIHRGRNEIQNKGPEGAKADLLWMSQGVYRDLIALQSAGLRFADPFAMELDGDIKAKGLEIKTSRRVPPGMAFLGEQSRVNRMTLLNKPNQSPAWGDGKEQIDVSGFIFTMDFPCAMVWKARSAFAYWSGLTES